MNKKSFLDAIDDETMAKLIDTTLKLEKSRNADRAKLNILKIVPAVAAILLVIGLINILPRFQSPNSDPSIGGPGSNAVNSYATDAPTEPATEPEITESPVLIGIVDGLVSADDFAEPTKLFVPPIVERTFFEEKILDNFSGRDYDKMLAYYVLVDATAIDDSDWDIYFGKFEEMVKMYPICETVPVYILDSSASERELDYLLGALREFTTLTGDDLISMYEESGIPYEELTMYNGENYEEKIQESTEVPQEDNANGKIVPNYGLNTAEDGTVYLEFKNKSLYAALLEYFELDRWYDYITTDMLAQIDSIEVNVRPEYKYIYENTSLFKEFGIEGQYLEYTINGKTLDLLPEKFMEGGVLEGHMEQASLDILDYFDYEPGYMTEEGIIGSGSGYYITKPDMSQRDKLLIYSILVWGADIRMPVEKNSDGSYYTDMTQASWSIYMLGVAARYYDQSVYDYSDSVYMPNLQTFGISGMHV